MKRIKKIKMFISLLIITTIVIVLISQLNIVKKINIGMYRELLNSDDEEIWADLEPVVDPEFTEKNINKCTITLDKNNKIVVKDGDKILTEKTDYLILSDKTVDGVRTVKISSISDAIINTGLKNIKIADYSSSLSWINGIYNKIGLTPDKYTTVWNSYKNEYIGKRYEAIPVGTVLYGSGYNYSGAEKGQLAIYLGNNKVACYRIYNPNTDEFEATLWTGDGYYECDLDVWIDYQTAELTIDSVEGGMGFFGWGWKDGNKKRGIGVNYLGAKTVTFDISTNIEDCEINLQPSTFEYNGKEIKPDVIVKFQNTVLTKDTDYTVKYENNINAGQGKIIINGKGNYTGSKTKTFTISKKTIAAPTAIEGLIYNGEEQTGIAEGEGYTITGNKATEVGEYTATATLNDKDNTEWNDQTIENKSISYTISKRKVSYQQSSSTVITELIYNGEEQIGKVVPESNDYEIHNNKATNAGTYTVTLSLKDKEHTCWVDNTVEDKVVGTYIIEKKQIDIPTAIEELEYNGEEQTGVAEGEDYTIIGNKATNAGSYTAVASLKDKNNTEWSDKTVADKQISWSIAEKVIEIESKEEYEVKDKEKIITNIQPNTNLNDFKDNIIANEEYEVKEGERAISNTEILKTGDVLKIGNEEYTIIVNGDVNGDGKANIKDILNINKHRLRKVILEGCYLEASDVNNDGKADIHDILKINKFRLGKDNKL